MEFTLEHIHRTAKRLGRLMPAKPSKDSNLEYSLKDGIFLMAPKLMEMKRMGFSTGEIATALESEGIAIKGQTLNRYLCEYQAMQEREAATAFNSGSSEANKEAAKKDTPGNAESTPKRGRKATASTPKSDGGVSASEFDYSESQSASEQESMKTESDNTSVFGETESASVPDSAESESAKKRSITSNRE
jgi:hypothetical protein